MESSTGVVDMVDMDRESPITLRRSIGAQELQIPWVREQYYQRCTLEVMNWVFVSDAKPTRKRC